jgi:hypothetical protein
LAAYSCIHPAQINALSVRTAKSEKLALFSIIAPYPPGGKKSQRIKLKKKKRRKNRRKTEENSSP